MIELAKKFVRVFSNVKIPNEVLANPIPYRRISDGQRSFFTLSNIPSSIYPRGRGSSYSCIWWEQGGKEQFQKWWDTEHFGQKNGISQGPAVRETEIHWRKPVCGWSKNRDKDEAREIYGSQMVQSCKAMPTKVDLSWNLSFSCSNLFFFSIEGFPGGSDGKESACNAGNMGSIPGLGRSTGGGHGNPLQYSCLENLRGQRSLMDYSPWGCKESDKTELLSTAQPSRFFLIIFQLYWGIMEKYNCKIKCTTWFYICTHCERGPPHFELANTFLIPHIYPLYVYMCVCVYEKERTFRFYSLGKF